MKSMPDKSVDAVITDPPYFVSESLITSIDNLKMLNDLRWEDDFLWIPSISQLLRDGGALYVFTGDDQISYLKKELRNNQFRVFGRLHWVKTNPLPSYTKRSYRGGVELALYCIRNGHKNDFNIDKQRDMRCVWEYPIVGGEDRTIHPTQKPLPLIREWINDCSQEGDTIFDPFMGSGTTGVACMQLGRNFIGCEIDPTYYAIAEKRIREASMQMLLPLEMNGKEGG
jgi:site-specific DNA-methyltransferase (adenine-specific)